MSRSSYEIIKEARGFSTIAGELKRLVASPMKSQGLLGKAVKNKIKDKPVLWHGARYGEESGFHTGKQDLDFIGPVLGNKRRAVENFIDPKVSEGENILSRIYSRFGGIGKIDSSQSVHGRIKNPAAIFDIDGSARETMAAKRVWDAANMGRKRVDVSNRLSKLYPDAERIHVAPTTFGGDKLREATIFPSINHTRTLAQVFPRGVPRSPEAARAALEKSFGPNWIVKSREGLASSDTNLTDKTLGKEMLVRLRAAIANNKGASRVIGQTRSEAMEVGPIGKKVDDLFSTAGIGMKKKEYRVHVVNGKVVPYATYGRGNVLDYAKTMLNPFRTKEVRDVEAAVQKSMNNVKGVQNRRGASYGFDVGVDKNGKPFIVETNPSEGSVASSWLNSPFVADSVVAAARGNLPHWVKLRNSAYGVGGVGTLGAMAASGPSPGGQTKMASEEESGLGTPTRLALGAVSADTGYNAIRLGLQAGQMEKLHDKGIRAFRAGGLGTADKARLLESYADHAGTALNRRAGGIPLHWLMRALTPSADASVMDRVRAAAGGSVNPAASKSIGESQQHYKQFAKTPQLAMLREIMTDNPTAKGFRPAPTTQSGKAVLSAMQGKGAEPNLKALFGGEAYKDKTLRGAMDKRFSDFFLGSQKTNKGFSWHKARQWGMTPYAKAMKPAAGILGALSLAGLVTAGASGRN